jgi:Caspase domain
MYDQTTIHLFLKRFKYAAFVVLLLLATPVKATDGLYYFNKDFLSHRQDDKPRMFLICVIDSDDESIGERCQEDLDGITYLFDELADWLDVEIEEPKIISGEQFSKAAVSDAIDNWLPSQQPGANDIVVFYYSGHGFRYAKDTSDYPRMWLKNGDNKNPEENNLSIESDVYDHIVKMGAGVNIVLSDCCNTYAPGDNVNFDNADVPVRKKVEHKRKQSDDEETPDDDDYGDRLFVPGHPVSILAAAAEKGEFAAGKTDVGGFFTYYLIDALEDCIYDNKIEPAWENIFKYVDENASYWAKSAACPDAKHNAQGRCLQTLEFKIDD